ncbi:MAG: hypothetical protein JWP13_681 [Candidatus Saccharibacteria bacterium]|nr:hypothetical protein [Candidatus Saccharibacteria bacterium]
MSNTLNSFPDKDRFSDPGELASPEQLALLARDNAEALASEPNLNFYGTEMHMRALVGVCNGMDNLTYNRLPVTAQTAVRRAVDSSYQYLASVGEAEKLVQDANSLDSQGISEADQTRIVLNRMQQHVSTAAQYEDYRRSSEMYRGLVRITPDHKIDRSVRDHNEVIAEQRSGDMPYDEDGIRDVLKVFGESFGPVIIGWHDVAPLNVPQHQIVSHAAGCLKAARPSTSYIE